MLGRFVRGFEYAIDADDDGFNATLGPETINNFTYVGGTDRDGSWRINRFDVSQDYAKTSTKTGASTLNEAWAIKDTTLGGWS